MAKEFQVEFLNYISVIINFILFSFNLGTVGRPMPGVVIRIAKESTTSPMGYETLVEADSDNTKLEIQSKFL